MTWDSALLLLIVFVAALYLFRRYRRSFRRGACGSCGSCGCGCGGVAPRTGKRGNAQGTASCCTPSARGRNAK